MKSAGFSALPFHENVPSFGEWGWWIGCKNEFMSEEQLKEKIMATDSLISETDYLTVPLLKASFNFGKNIIDYKEIKINSITNNVISTYYIEEIKKNYH
jgi:spermidine synthase